MNSRQRVDKNIQIIATVIGAAYNMIEDYNNQKEIQAVNPYHEYNLLQTLGKGLIGGAVGFGTAFLFCGIKNHFFFNYDDITPIDENEYLKEALLSYEEGDNFEANLKTEELMECLNEEFEEYLENPVEYQGSIAKGTFVKGISDIDVAVRFSYNSFKVSDTKEILYDFFKNLDDFEVINVRRQPNSVGVICNVNNEEFKIDFVPQRLQTNGQDYSIHRTPLKWGEKESRKKTNTKVHENFGRYSQSKKEMVRLLKVFKTVEQVPISGFLLERLVIRIMDNKINKLPRLNRFARFKMVVNEIANEISNARVLDPANSNNELTENLTDRKRNKIQDIFDKFISELESDSRILRKKIPVYQVDV
jgi:hypothetical protein